MPLDPTDALREALVSHDMKARLDDGWVAVEGSDCALRARAFETERHPQGSVARLDVSVALDDGRLLLESCGAPGKDAEHAAVNGLQRFFVGSLHPILGGFFGHREHQEMEKWQIAGAEFEAFLGPLLVQGSGDKPPTPPPIPDALRKTVQARAEASRQPHWIRLFYARFAKEPATFEALWDNEPWEDMQDALELLDWPEIERYVSFRQFLVVAPTGPREKGPHGYRNIERRRALRRGVREGPRVNDDALHAKLVASGVDSSLANAVVTFTPLGFSEVLLRGRCQLSPDYQVLNEKNEIAATRPLAGEPAFVAAREVAAALLGPQSQERFMVIASRCSRFSAVNQALNRGSKLETSSSRRRSCSCASSARPHTALSECLRPS